MEDYEFTIQHEDRDVKVVVEGELVTIYCIHDIINQESLLDTISAIIASKDATVH